MTPQQATLYDAVAKLIKAKGRFHTEQNYAALVAAFDAETAARRAPAPTEPAVDRDEVCATCKGTGVVDDGEINCSVGGIPFENGPVKCVKDCPACALATPASPAVSGKMPLTESQMHAIAKVIARRVAQNASVAPELYFAPALFALQDSFGITAVRAVTAPAPLAPSDFDMAKIASIKALADRAKPELDALMVKYGIAAPQVPQASQPTSTPAPMHRLICQLASLKSRTPEAVNLLVEEAKRVMAGEVARPTSAPGSILVRIAATTDDYDDVHPDLILEDAMRVSPYGWPQGFTFEVVQDGGAEGGDGEQGVAK